MVQRERHRQRIKNRHEQRDVESYRNLRTYDKRDKWTIWQNDRDRQRDKLTIWQNDRETNGQFGRTTEKQMD